jgi:hypothetical protein
MPLNPKSATDYVLAVDTNTYAGDFMRTLFAYVTGKVNPDEEENTALLGVARTGREALGLDPERLDGPNPLFDNLLDLRYDDANGDGPVLRYCATLTTPGMYVSGGEVVPASELGGAAAIHPAFASVALFLKRPPTPAEVAHVKARVEHWIPWFACPAGFKVLGYRLLWCQKAWSETSLGELGL